MKTDSVKNFHKLLLFAEWLTEQAYLSPTKFYPCGVRPTIAQVNITWCKTWGLHNKKKKKLKKTKTKKQNKQKKTQNKFLLKKNVNNL